MITIDSNFIMQTLEGMGMFAILVVIAIVAALMSNGDKREK